MPRVLMPPPPVSAHPIPGQATLSLKEAKVTCSTLLADLKQQIPLEGLNVGHLLRLLGKKGVLLACILFALPSVLPIPIPGISVLQGLILIFLGVGLIGNRMPVLPARLGSFHVRQKYLHLLLEKGAALLLRVERWSYPRFGLLTGNSPLRKLNGSLLLGSSIVLMMPFSIPFTNLLPGYAILLLAFGTLNRDGWMVLAGYFMFLVTFAYIGLSLFLGIGWIKTLFAFFY